MDRLNRIFPSHLTMRRSGQMVALTLGLAGCFISWPGDSQPSHYFWDSTPQIKQIHAAVACTSLHALLAYDQLYSSGTEKDKREEATLLGESSAYASDAPADPPCQRAGQPAGPVTTPGASDRVRNITASNGVVSFEWDFASAVSDQPQHTKTFYTYPEYLVPGSPTPER